MPRPSRDASRRARSSDRDHDGVRLPTVDRNGGIRDRDCRIRRQDIRTRPLAVTDVARQPGVFAKWHPRYLTLPESATGSVEMAMDLDLLVSEGSIYTGVRAV